MDKAYLTKINSNNVHDLINNINKTHQIEYDYLKNNEMAAAEKKICLLLNRHSPIVYKPGIQKESQGTSIYIQYNERKYILTAGHVFTGGLPVSDTNPPQIDIKAFYIGNGIPLNKIKRGIICPPAEEDNYQELDYALFWVDDDIAKQLEEVYIPYQINTEKFAYNFLPEYGFLYGFPATKNVSNKFKKGNAISDLCLRLPLDHLFSFQHSGKNIGFTFARSKGASIEELKKGQTHTICKLNGMSGCGIWGIPDYPIINDWANVNYILSGLFTTYYSDKEQVIGFGQSDIINFLNIATEEIRHFSSDIIRFYIKFTCM